MGIDDSVILMTVRGKYKEKIEDEVLLWLEEDIVRVNLIASNREIEELKEGDERTFYLMIKGGGYFSVYAFLSKDARYFVQVTDIGLAFAKKLFTHADLNHVGLDGIVLQLAMGNVQFFTDAWVLKDFSNRFVNENRNNAALKDLVKTLAKTDTQNKPNAPIIMEAKETLLALGFMQPDVDSALNKLDSSEFSRSSELVQRALQIINT